MIVEARCNKLLKCLPYVCRYFLVDLESFLRVKLYSLKIAGHDVDDPFERYLSCWVIFKRNLRRCYDQFFVGPVLLKGCVASSFHVRLLHDNKRSWVEVFLRKQLLREQNIFTCICRSVLNKN